MLTHHELRGKYPQFLDAVSHFFDDPSVRKEAINHGVLLLLLLGALLVLRTTSERTAQGQETQDLTPLIAQTYRALTIEVEGIPYEAKILDLEQCGLNKGQCALVIFEKDGELHYNSVPLSELQYQQTE